MSTLTHALFTLLAWRIGVAHINEVTLRRARLVLGWVTLSGFIFRCGTLISVCDQPPGQLSLAIPLWIGAMSTSQRAVTPCRWEVKAGMARVCGK